MKKELIIEKIDEKTASDPIMKEFIANVFEVEVQNKNFRAQYVKYIDAAVKKEAEK